jgi:hypothetical protein
MPNPPYYLLLICCALLLSQPAQALQSLVAINKLIVSLFGSTRA